MRTSIILTVLDQVDMTKKEEVSHYLRPSRMKRDNDTIHNVVNVIKDCMNPFDNLSEENHLYNIATGKPTSVETEQFLLNITEIGNKARKQFIDECVEWPKRFEERIGKQKLKRFASEAGRNKITSKDGKVMTACFIRNLFCSLLYLSLEKKIDIGEVLKYHLTPYSLALSHVDGSMIKSPKSALLKYLESKLISYSLFFGIVSC